MWPCGPRRGPSADVLPGCGAGVNAMPHHLSPMLTTRAANTNVMPPADVGPGAAQPGTRAEMPGTPGPPRSADTGDGEDGPPGLAPRSPPADPGRPAGRGSGTATRISSG